jgi:glycosyltransferase involved in cell wall biosynthesis
MPKVSVIIPTYNYGHFLRESIQSVLDQTFGDFEVIVVDDGSTDDTKQMVSSIADPRIKYIYQENRGVSAARNTGISACCGDYVALLDSDDIWVPQKLELQVRILDSRPEVSVVCSDVNIIDEHTGVFINTLWNNDRRLGPFNPRMAPKKLFRRLLSRGCFIHPSSTLFRREVFDEVGLFDESLRTHEVWDMSVRVLLRFDMALIDIPLVNYRQHDTSLSTQWHEMHDDGISVLYKAIGTLPLKPGDVRAIKQRMARNNCEYGSGLVVNDMIPLGREKLLTSIKLNPWNIKPYIYLAGSLLGSHIILGIKSLKKRLEYNSLRGQPDSTT